MRPERNKNALVTVAVLIFLFARVEGSHFRGGTISWKSEGGTKVHFYYKLGWTYGNGPGCTQRRIGQHVSSSSISDNWECQSGNCGTQKLHDAQYYCTGANQAENWEQGKDDFTHVFPSNGPFTIGFSSSAWITLANGQGGGTWNVATTVDLRTRSDTGNPNSSPESLSKPMYYVPFDCEVRLRLPVIDPDNDKVRCRWATGAECGSVCNALPRANLDEETCTLTFNTTAFNTYVAPGVYAVALTIEDFPKTTMTMGGVTTKTPSDVISSIPLQFLVQVKKQPGPCDAGPRFVPPTPKEGDVIVIEEGDKLEVDLFADNGNDTSAKADKISTSGPVAITQSPVIPDKNRKDTYTTTVSWQTTNKDIGNHILCASVANNKGRSGEQRCFTIQVVPKGCKPSPCQNNGKCVANNGNYTCICRPGFTGQNCEVNIDDCVSNTCSPGTYCADGINTYTCVNITTTTSTTLMTTTEKNYTGMCPLEYEHCDCTIRPNRNERGWMDLSRIARDALCFSFGFPIGLVLSVVTFFFLFKPCERHFDSTKRSKRYRMNTNSHIYAQD